MSCARCIYNGGTGLVVKFLHQKSIQPTCTSLDPSLLSNLLSNPTKDIYGSTLEDCARLATGFGLVPSPKKGFLANTRGLRPLTWKSCAWTDKATPILNTTLEMFNRHPHILASRCIAPKFLRPLLKLYGAISAERQHQILFAMQVASAREYGIRCDFIRHTTENFLTNNGKGSTSHITHAYCRTHELHNMPPRLGEAIRSKDEDSFFFEPSPRSCPSCMNCITSPLTSCNKCRACLACCGHSVCPFYPPNQFRSLPPKIRSSILNFPFKRRDQQQFLPPTLIGPIEDPNLTGRLPPSSPQSQNSDNDQLQFHPSVFIGPIEAPNVIRRHPRRPPQSRNTGSAYSHGEVDSKNVIAGKRSRRQPPQTDPSTDEEMVENTTAASPPQLSQKAQPKKGWRVKCSQSKGCWEGAWEYINDTWATANPNKDLTFEGTIVHGSRCCSQVPDGGCRVKFDTMLGFDWTQRDYHFNLHLKDNDNHWHRIEENEPLRDVCACQPLPPALAQTGSFEDPIPICRLPPPRSPQLRNNEYHESKLNEPESETKNGYDPPPSPEDKPGK